MLAIPPSNAVPKAGINSDEFSVKPVMLLCHCRIQHICNGNGPLIRLGFSVAEYRVIMIR
jgi:hypothetical protein